MFAVTLLKTLLPLTLSCNAKNLSNFSSGHLFWSDSSLCPFKINPIKIFFFLQYLYAVFIHGNIHLMANSCRSLTLAHHSLANQSYT